jgi:hypothetical protein
MTGSEEGMVVTGMALSRSDIADAAVAMLDGVPMYKLGRPGPGLVQAGEAAGGELRPVFGRAEQCLGMRMVIRHARSRGGRFNLLGSDSPQLAA